LTLSCNKDDPRIGRRHPVTEGGTAAAVAAPTRAWAAEARATAALDRASAAASFWAILLVFKNMKSQKSFYLRPFSQIDLTAPAALPLAS
jgi:hypothetical protein